MTSFSSLAYQNLVQLCQDINLLLKPLPHLDLIWSLRTNWLAFVLMEQVSYKVHDFSDKCIKKNVSVNCYHNIEKTYGDMKWNARAL